MITLGYKTFLKSATGFAIVGEASTIGDAKLLLEGVRPDIAIVDLMLGDESGLELVAHIASHWPRTAILCSSMHAEQTHGEEAALAGASGYVHKQDSPKLFLSAMRAMADGRPWFSPALQKRLLARARGERESIEPLRTLTARETQILRHIGAGLSKTEIAARLAISANTVEAHRTNIKRKLARDSNRELIRLAVSAFPELRLATNSVKAEPPQPAVE